MPASTEPKENPLRRLKELARTKNGQYRIYQARALGWFRLGTSQSDARTIALSPLTTPDTPSNETGARNRMRELGFEEDQIDIVTNAMIQAHNQKMKELGDMVRARNANVPVCISPSGEQQPS